MHARVSILPRVIESMIESKSLIELGLITGFGNEWLRIGGVKMSIDGGITGRNACFYDPYEDDEHNHGIIRIQQDELNHTVQKCHDAGLRCCVHAIGDRAFDMALDAYENAVEKSPRKDHRHRIEHMGNWLALRNGCSAWCARASSRSRISPSATMSATRFSIASAKSG